MPDLPRRDTPAASLLKSSIVWDNHGCMPMRADADFLPQLERYRASGTTVISLNAGFGGMTLQQHLHVLSCMRRWISARPESYRLVSTVDDIHACKRDGRLGVVFDIEGMCPVIDHPSYIQTFYELGVRWMLIAYNLNNAAGGGCMDDDRGLTAVGRMLIDEMQRVGMVLCLSHCGARTAAETLEYSRHPVIFSHSNPCGETPHRRNVPDTLLVACAAKGGVVGLSGIGPFLGARSDADLLERLLSQVRYLLHLVGPDHIGLGLDYVFDRFSLEDNIKRNPALYPAGLSGGLAMIEPECMERIAEGLLQEGLGEPQIRGILGENWLRIAARVWL